MPTTDLNGGVKVIFSLTDLLVEAGHAVDLFSYSNNPGWYTPKANLVEAKNLSDVDMSRYDFVVVSNAAFIPLVLPLLGQARCVLLAQDYESFHHALDATYESFLTESAAFKSLYSLPVPIISTSRPIARLIKERVGKTAYYISVGLNKEVLVRQTHTPSKNRKRILFVGNYLMPYKGIRDGLAALEKLSSIIPVELVLITREERGRRLFGSHSFPKEVHFCPPERDVPEIIASSDVYCCTSWYEGLGLPALEAFCCGTPVVSTRTIGVDDYAVDGVNLILANANDPDDLSDKIRRILTDSALAAHLVEGGFETVRNRYDWAQSLASFVNAIQDIDAGYKGAGELDLEMLRQSLVNLECEGFLTPIETHRQFQRLSDRLSEIAAGIAATPPIPAQIEGLESVRDELKCYLSNERTQYFSAFKAKYDLCLLVLELAVTSDRVHLPRLLRPHDGAPAATDANSLTEIRYTKP
ncbi:MAG: glycosyltransferase family 4 protein [Gemmatimonadaceae bacterium]